MSALSLLLQWSQGQTSRALGHGVVSSHHQSMEKKKSFFRSAAGSGGFMGNNLVARVGFVCLLWAVTAAGAGAGAGASSRGDPGGISKFLRLWVHRNQWVLPRASFPTEHPPPSPSHPGGHSALSPAGPALLGDSPHPPHPLQIQGEATQLSHPFPNPALPPCSRWGFDAGGGGIAGPRRRFEQELQGKLNKMAQPRRRRQRRVLPKQE